MFTRSFARKAAAVAGTLAMTAAAGLTTATAASAAAETAEAAAPSSAPSSGPVGPPYEIHINSAGQKAIVGGAAATANVVACVSNGVACTVTPAITAIVTPFVSDAVICPDNGTRVLAMQAYSVPPTSSNPDGIIPRIESNGCIPA